MAEVFNIRQDLETVRNLIHSGLPGSKLLDLLTDLITGQISFCFAILDGKKVASYARAEVVSLLHGLALGEIEGPSLNYLITRYNRLVKNLLAQGAIRQVEHVYFSAIPGAQDLKDWEEAAERYVFNRRQSPEQEEKDTDAKKKYLGPARKTRERELVLRKIPAFRPQCLQGKTTSGAEQLDLF